MQQAFVSYFFHYHYNYFTILTTLNDTFYLHLLACKIFINTTALVVVSPGYKTIPWESPYYSNVFLLLQHLM